MLDKMEVNHLTYTLEKDRQNYLKYKAYLEKQIQEMLNFIKSSNQDTKMDRD